MFFCSSDSALSAKSQTEDQDGDDDEFEDTLADQEIVFEDVIDGAIGGGYQHQIVVTESPFITRCREAVQSVAGSITQTYHCVRHSLAKESTRVYLCYAMIIFIFCLHIHLLIRIGTVNERLEIFTNMAKQAIVEKKHRQLLSHLLATNSQMAVAPSSGALVDDQHLTINLSSSPSPECSQCHFNFSPT